MSNLYTSQCVESTGPQGCILLVCSLYLVAHRGVVTVAKLNFVMLAVTLLILTLESFQSSSPMFHYSTRHIRSKLDCYFVFDHFFRRVEKKQVLHLFIATRPPSLITQDALDIGLLS